MFQVYKNVFWKVSCEYPIEIKDKIDKKVFLNPNHTHIICVNNNERPDFGGEIDFRATLETYIRTKPIKNGLYNKYKSDFKIRLIIY